MAAPNRPRTPLRPPAPYRPQSATPAVPGTPAAPAASAPVANSAPRPAPRVPPPVARTAAAIPLQRAIAAPPMRAVQRSEDPYGKYYPKKIAKKTPRRAAAREHTVINTQPRLSKREQAIVGVVTGPGNPGYNPVKDSFQHPVWDGRRGSLRWYANVQNAMAPLQAAGCQIGKSGCTGGGDSIDHKPDYATAQSGLTRYVVCDGMHHFSACYKEDALDTYNGENPSNTAALNVDHSKLQWSCTHCNSSKSGQRGVYENPPRWIEPCPGGCGYVFKGEESST